MPLLPTNNQALAQWFAEHIDDWADDPAAIGLTAEQVTALQATLTQCQSRLADYQSLKQAARDARMTSIAASDALRYQGSQLVQTIRAFAKASTDPSTVYAAASIPAPAARTPQPAPVAPDGLSFKLLTDGSVQLTWNNAQANATFFTLQRKQFDQDGNAGSWETVASVGGKQYRDEDVPAGISAAMYQIRSARKDKFSVWSDPVMVRFGKEGQQVPSAGSDLRIAA